MEHEAVAAVLRGAMKRLEDPRAWLQDAESLAGDGTTVEPWDPEATAWCLVGALYTTPGDAATREAFALLRRLADGSGSLQGWNDAPDRTHAQVLDLIDRAIASVEGRP